MVELFPDGPAPFSTCGDQFSMNVGFAARGPRHRSDVAAQASRMQATSLVGRIGQLNTGFENTVLKVVFARGIQAAR